MWSYILVETFDPAVSSSRTCPLSFQKSRKRGGQREEGREREWKGVEGGWERGEEGGRRGKGGEEKGRRGNL